MFTLVGTWMYVVQMHSVWVCTSACHAVTHNMLTLVVNFYIVFHRHPYAREHAEIISFCFRLTKYYTARPVLFLIDLLKLQIPSLMEIEKDTSGIILCKDDEERVVECRRDIVKFIRSHHLHKQILQTLADIMVKDKLLLLLT